MDNLNLTKIKKKVHQSLKNTGYNNFLLAISGGSDSLFLLKMIYELSNEYDYTIRAIHVNHNFSPNCGDMENYCVSACKCVFVRVHSVVFMIVCVHVCKF